MISIFLFDNLLYLYYNLIPLNKSIYYCYTLLGQKLKYEDGLK
jgi:hypothetical protein